MANDLDSNVRRNFYSLSEALADSRSLAEKIGSSSTDLIRIFTAAKVQTDEAQEMDINGQLGLNWLIEMKTAKQLAMNLEEFFKELASHSMTFRNQLDQVIDKIKSGGKLSSSDLGGTKLEIEKLLRKLADLIKHFDDFKKQMVERCKTEAEKLLKSLKESEEEMKKMKPAGKGWSGWFHAFIVAAVGAGCIAIAGPAAASIPARFGIPSGPTSEIIKTVGHIWLALGSAEMVSNAPDEKSINAVPITEVEAHTRKLTENVESIRNHIRQIDLQIEEVTAQINMNEIYQEAFQSILKEVMKSKCSKDEEEMELR